jgi:hypothetical protein
VNRTQKTENRGQEESKIENPKSLDVDQCRLALAKAEPVAPHLDFERISPGRGSQDLALNARGETHFQEATSHFAVARDRNDASGLTNGKFRQPGHRSRLRPNQHAHQLGASKSQALVAQSDEARAARLYHLDARTVAEAHFS